MHKHKRELGMAMQQHRANAHGCPTRLLRGMYNIHIYGGGGPKMGDPNIGP